VEEPTTGKQASKQASASANVLMMLKISGRLKSVSLSLPLVPCPIINFFLKEIKESD
jgi:hypothetical protein